nr:hypothetical protein [Tanacetum cinerariifolium]
MSRDVITVGSTMRIPLLYRGEYSQWCERFMNYLEEQTHGEAMINSIQNGDQPLPVIAQVKAVILYEYETFKATEGEQLLDTYLHYLQVINDLKKCGYKKDNYINIDALYNIVKQNQGDVNDALGYKKKVVVITSDPLALVAEKTKVSKQKEKIIVSSDSEGSGADDFSELKKITALLAKAFNRRTFYSKPTNNNLRTSSTSQSANKKQEFVKSDDKKVEKKADEKKIDMSKVKCYNCKKEGHFAKDYKKAKVKDYNYYKTTMLLAKKDDSDESSSFAEETIAEVAYYTSESESESEYETSKYYDNSTNYGLFVNNDDDQKNFHDAIESASENFIENHIYSQKDYDKSEVDYNDSEQKKHLVDKLILNTFEEQNNEFNEQIKVLNEKNADLLAQTEVLQDQLKVKHVVIDTHTECQAQYAKLEEERYEYMIRYFALCDNDKQHRKKIDEQEILFDKMSPKDMRPSLYDGKVFGLGYTPMFLISSDEALEIEKFKRARENRIELHMIMEI